MSSEPPPSAAELTRSKRKRSAATEADPEVAERSHLRPRRSRAPPVMMGAAAATGKKRGSPINLDFSGAFVHSSPDPGGNDEVRWASPTPAPAARKGKVVARVSPCCWPAVYTVSPPSAPAKGKGKRTREEAGMSDEGLRRDIADMSDGELRREKEALQSPFGGLLGEHHKRLLPLLENEAARRQGIHRTGAAKDGCDRDGEAHSRAEKMYTFDTEDELTEDDSCKYFPKTSFIRPMKKNYGLDGGDGDREAPSRAESNYFSNFPKRTYIQFMSRTGGCALSEAAKLSDSLKDTSKRDEEDFMEVRSLGGTPPTCRSDGRIRGCALSEAATLSDSLKDDDDTRVGGCAAAEATRSTRKRSAATEADPEVVDLDHDASGTTVARGCHMNSSEIQDPLRSKRLRRRDEEVKAKGGPESSKYRCSRKRAREDGTRRFANKRKKVKNLEQNKQSMLQCQLFVKVGGSHISMQKNLRKTTVKMLVQSTYHRFGGDFSDFYCTYAGRCLKEEMLLSYYPIKKDSTIMIQHRLRAGRQQTIQCATWTQIIAGHHPFHTVLLPPGFVDARTQIATARFLSADIQKCCIQVLVAISKIHLRNRTLNGNFGAEHILFYKGMVFIDDLIQEDLFSDEAGRNDYNTVCGVFRPVFLVDPNTQELALHCDHLLDLLFSYPANIDLRSPAVIASLTNHYAVQTYAEKIATCKILHEMLPRLSGQEMALFRLLIPTPDWAPAQNVPALRDRWMFNARWSNLRQQRVSTYGVDCREFALLEENYLKHTFHGIRLEVVEAALSLALSGQNFFPKLLQALATLSPPFQDPPFDLLSVWKQSHY